MYYIVFHCSDVEVDQQQLLNDSQRDAEIEVPTLLPLRRGTIPIDSTGKCVRTCYLLASDCFVCAAPSPATIWLSVKTDISSRPSGLTVYMPSLMSCAVEAGLPCRFQMTSSALHVRTMVVTEDRNI